MNSANDLYCRDCGVKLTEDNWFKHFQNKPYKNYWCKSCYYKYYKPYRKNNITTTTKNGKIITLIAKKRTNPNVCEICGVKKVRLHYHHLEQDEKEWMPLKVLPGIWLCRYCHTKANFIENGILTFLDKYHKLLKKAYSESNDLIVGVE